VTAPGPGRQRHEGKPSAQSCFLGSLRAQRQRPFVVAHRGASAHAPENTIEAAELGHAAGAEAWELDVRLTRDGVPVVLHDETLRRTTDVARRFPRDPRSGSDYRLADFDLAEVRTLDAGSWFLGGSHMPRSAAWFGTRGELGLTDVARFGSGEVRVPTLRECLALTRRLGWLVNVEVKSRPGPDTRLIDAVLSEVEASGIADRVLISSFNHADVAKASASRLPVATGVLTETHIPEAGRYVRENLGADCYHTSGTDLRASVREEGLSEGEEGARIAAFLARDSDGVPVLCYTVNDRTTAATLCAAGVAGLFTDHPLRLLRMFDRGDARCP
jgi:glycerophosphoryl diester phosphodiesterase